MQESAEFRISVVGFGTVGRWLVRALHGRQLEGTQNGVTCRASPLGEVSVSGPGAGPELAGQGVLADLIGLARNLKGGQAP